MHRVIHTLTHTHTESYTHLHTHTHTHTYMFRASRGTTRASLHFLRISEVFVIHRVARSQDYRNQRICAISRSAANGKYRTQKKGMEPRLLLHPNPGPVQGNSTRIFFWCTPVHVLNHTSEEITIFAPKSFGQLTHALLHYSTWSNPIFTTEDVLASNRGRPRF